jgi:hypothetical protein
VQALAGKQPLEPSNSLPVADAKNDIKPANEKAPRCGAFLVA